MKGDKISVFWMVYEIRCVFQFCILENFYIVGVGIFQIFLRNSFALVTKIFQLGNLFRILNCGRENETQIFHVYLHNFFSVMIYADFFPNLLYKRFLVLFLHTEPELLK
jgi:hypothetical protein